MTRATLTRAIAAAGRNPDRAIAGALLLLEGAAAIRAAQYYHRNPKG